jgi:hypothetical protein
MVEERGTASSRAPEELHRAPVTPCPECPWRVANKDRPVPEKYVPTGVFTRSEQVELWAGLRHPGGRQRCHMTDGNRETFPNGGDPEWAAAGYQLVPEHAKVRECGGSVAVALRELRLLQAAGSWETYHEQRPAGFTREAATLWALRLQGRQVPGYPPLRRVQVDDAEVIDPTSADQTVLELMSSAQLSALLEAVTKVSADLPSDGSTAGWRTT